MTKHKARWASFPTVALLVLSVALLSGCRSKQGNAANISGKVTYKGVVVTGGTLTIHHPGSAPYTTAIRSDGTFSNSDLPIGEAKVTIETESVNPKKSRAVGAPVLPPGMKPPMPSGEGGGGAAATYVRIPPQYSTGPSTPLSWDLKAGSNKKDFDLE